MNYPGNASLSSAVKERVISTFEQTLALYHQRRTDEVVAGCTLILQMDPVFDPARKLMEKTRNPALAIDVDSLLPEGGGGAEMKQAREAMAARDFERVVHLTSAILSDDLLNDDARVLGDQAREKLEAAPFISQFTRRSEQNIASGNIAAAKMDLEKARSLDPNHPDVLRIVRTLASRDSAPPPPAAASPSFVIEERPSTSTGRSAAQATDFGFAFEEEKTEDVSFADFSFDSGGSDTFDVGATAAPAATPSFSGFSFDAPDTGAAPTDSYAPASYAPADEFDFATASVATNSDDQAKIRQYLSDGDRAFAGGDYQQAIDLWSRIFLIDVTNDEASDRIESAKAKRRDLEQQVEPLITSGITAFERGNAAQAREDLSAVLRLDPQNSAAKDYLDRLDSAAASESNSFTRSNPYIAPSMDENLDLGMLDEDPLPPGFDSPLIPPPPGSAPATSAKASGKAAKAPSSSSASSRKLPILPIAAAIAVLALLGGGWFFWQRSQEKPQVEAGAGQALIARATTLAGIGKYDQAIALLQDIEPNDSQHDQALVMIADLRKKKSSAAQMIDGVPVDQYYEQRVTEAQTAFAAHDYAVAKTAFAKALSVKALPPDLKAQYDAATQEVGKLDAAKALFAERKFAEAIANLEPLLAQDPANLAIQKLLVDAHFNHAAIALQEERTSDAMRELDEVLKSNPADEVAKRSRELAARYDGEPKDLLYKIYVKYLPVRPAP